MAESKIVLTRLARVERDVGELKTAVVQITHILVDHGERMDSGFRTLRGEMQELRESLGQRLDRLITVTIEERTESADRLANIERRLSKLEDAQARRPE